MTLAKTLLALTIAGVGVLAFYADSPPPDSTTAALYPGVGLGALLQPLEH